MDRRGMNYGFRNYNHLPVLTYDSHYMKQNADFQEAFRKLRALPSSYPRIFNPPKELSNDAQQKDFSQGTSGQVLDFKLFLIKNEFFGTFSFYPYQFSCPLREILT